MAEPSPLVDLVTARANSSTLSNTSEYPDLILTGILLGASQRVKDYLNATNGLDQTVDLSSPAENVQVAVLWDSEDILAMNAVHSNASESSGQWSVSAGVAQNWLSIPLSHRVKSILNKPLTDMSPDAPTMFVQRKPPPFVLAVNGINEHHPLRPV